MSGHLALGFAKHSALGIRQQLSGGMGCLQACCADYRRDRLLTGNTMRVGNPGVAGPRTRGNKARRWSSAGSAGRWPASAPSGAAPRHASRRPAPHGSFPSEGPGRRYANARRVHRRTPRDGRCRRNSHRRGRPCAGRYRSPPNRRAYFAPRATAPPQDRITSRATARPPA